MSIIESSNCENISDTVYKFYVESENELIPNSNYYFGLYIDSDVIAFSNVFEKTQIGGLNLYGIDFFKYHPDTKNKCIPLNLIVHQSKHVNIIGFIFPLKKRNMKNYSKYYYEISNDIELKSSCETSYEMIVSYHDSELTRDIRNTRGERGLVSRYDSNDFYTDNVFRFVSGMYGPAFKYKSHITDSLLNYLDVKKIIQSN